MSNHDPAIRRLATNNKARAFIVAAAAAMLLESCTTGAPTPAPKTVVRTVTAAPSPSKETPSPTPHSSLEMSVDTQTINLATNAASRLMNTMGGSKIKNEQLKPGDISNQKQAQAEYQKGKIAFPNMRITYANDENGPNIVMSVKDGVANPTHDTLKTINYKFDVVGSTVPKLNGLVASGHDFQPADFRGALLSGGAQLSSVFISDGHGDNGEINISQEGVYFGVVNTDGHQLVIGDDPAESAKMIKAFTTQLYNITDSFAGAA